MAWMGRYLELGLPEMEAEITNHQNEQRIYHGLIYWILLDNI